MAPSTRLSRKRQRSSDSEPLGEPATSRRRFDTPPPDTDMAPKGDVVLFWPNALARMPDGSYDIGPQRLRVSSTLLTLKSRVFSAMLDGHGFAETNELRERGQIELEMDGLEDNYEAFFVLLNALYAHHRRVPERVDVYLLGDIATLADKYELHEVIEPYIGGWMDRITARLPDETMCPSILPLLWTCWVFRMEPEFRAFTKIVERTGSNEDVLTSDQYPLPDSVDKLIKSKRARVFGILRRRFLRASAERLQASTVGHWQDEMAMAAVGGLLMRKAHQLGLVDLKGAAAKRLSFEDVQRSVVEPHEKHVRFQRFDGTVHTFAESCASIMRPTFTECRVLLEGISLEEAMPRPVESIDLTGDDDAGGPSGTAPQPLATSRGSVFNVRGEDVIEDSDSELGSPIDG